MGFGLSLTDITLMALMVSLAISLNLVAGFARFLVFSQAAFYGVGAYGVAIASTSLGLSFWPSMLIAVVLAGIGGLIVGLPILRTGGAYFAMLTWGLGIIAQNLAHNLEVTGGPFGIGPIEPPVVFGLTIDTQLGFAVMAWIAALVTLAVVVLTMRSRAGWALQAHGEDSIAAATLGMSRIYSLLVFVITAMLAGLAGGVFGYFIGYIFPATFGIDLSILLIIALLLGGLGSITGSVIGAVFIVVVQDVLRDYPYTADIIFGIVLVLIVHLRPEGLLSYRAERRIFTRLLHGRKEAAL